MGLDMRSSSVFGNKLDLNLSSFQYGLRFFKPSQVDKLVVLSQ